MVNQTEDNYNATQQNTNLQPTQDMPLEKDFSRNGNSGSGYTNGNNGSYGRSNSAYHLDDSHDPENALKRIQTAGSISISPELFEKIYLSPQNKVSGDLRKTFGNPTPIALAGFLLSLTPLSCILMGWRGAGGGGASDVGAYFFFGGLLMILGSVGEWIIGNTFPFVVFGSFGAFWLQFGATLQPFYNAYGAFSTTSSPAEGLTTVGFNASYAFFLLFMALLCLIYFICSLRTNLVFAIIFLTLIPAFICLAASYWQLAKGNAATAGTLLVAAGAITFVTDMAGWWIFAAIMLAALDFPFQLPVGDLSRYIKSATEIAKAKRDSYEA